MIFERGPCVLHLLREARLALARGLGLVGGRPGDRGGGAPHRLGRLGAPVLDECFAHFECRVANVMDTGSSTCFLGDVMEVGHGAATAPRGAVMTAAYFREHMPAGWRKDYEDHLKEAQRFAEERSRDVRAAVR